MTQALLFKIIIEKPLLSVAYGLQKGKGAVYETEQIQLGSDQDIIFEVNVPYAMNKSGTLGFSGPYIQGSAGNHFLYIDIGNSAGQINSKWSRRMKIPVPNMAELMGVDASINVLETKVPGIGKDGGPNCATVKPFAGWQIK